MSHDLTSGCGQTNLNKSISVYTLENGEVNKLFQTAQKP